MKIAIGTDHAGFRYKERLRDLLIRAGHDVVDMGAHSEKPSDYPVYIGRVARAVRAKAVDRGIVLGGSGNGEAMAANRFRGVRCALCYDVKTAVLSRKHNNANIVSLGARLTGFPLAWRIVRTWLATDFEGGRHERRIRLLDRLR